MDNVLSDSEGKILLQIARQAICGRLGMVVADDIMQSSVPDKEYGTFVTLKKNGQLRGCIGNLQASGTVADGVRQNAVHAAFNDSRFLPLTAEELPEIEIDISVLNQPKILEYSSAEDLISKLRPGIDGVILSLGMARATFLPQVWEQLPVAEQFLGNLCRKAGLAESAWKDSLLQIETYQAQCFAEEKQ
ncbi:MAG: AmmeMemoRadiSam system protein A [Desulfocapsa sp.]|nr:MAG: AmmeMemoRadiSam system protein A [Desulfocapsa sp.]